MFLARLCFFSLVALFFLAMPPPPSQPQAASFPPFLAVGILFIFAKACCFCPFCLFLCLASVGCCDGVDAIPLSFHAFVVFDLMAPSGECNILSRFKVRPAENESNEW